ncbi:MAG: hypothetical protein MPJ50_01310 [Pirellulales bacterium]|nr:hypothetical protein [Pirellulales bacterium]
MLRAFFSGILFAACLTAIFAAALPAQAQRYGVSRRPITSYGYGVYRPAPYLVNHYPLPGAVSGSGRLYGQYSPALDRTRYYGRGNSFPSRYLINNHPGSLSRLYYYGGIYRTPSRLYSGGSRIYGSRYNTYTSPYGVYRPSGGSVLYVPPRVTPQIRYRFTH